MEGHRINVGDCALFKLPQDSPPFVGIIRCLTAGKENKLKLGVNWLYRPAEVKLGKGNLLEAAPNEIFYSFHKDEIPAASLLHLCKVAFLPKDVDLLSGICSFVCRRVYDVTNKCLWWLTDQDYINERQEEVDQLLYKTRLEMHAKVQPGGRSPKPMNGLTSTSQLKPGSDSVQNSTSLFPSEGKGKKRECWDQVSEPVKRERTSKMDDGDSGHSRPEINFKSEIAKISEKGGLEDSEGVEKLVQLMVPEKNEKKIDLVSRSMLAGVIAATDKFDCLSCFVQLRGLLVFDEWLREVHKGKIGDSSGSKDDRLVDDFLLTLLRALDKLPVNLTALQMCNVGKSVNHLRSHKNVEIQKKARSLVDTWKKRVEAEMDAKSGSNQAVPWSARPRLCEVSHSGSKHSGPSEVAVKSSVTPLSASKTGSGKLALGETAAKSASASQVPIKAATSPASARTNLKDGQARNTTVVGTSDPQTTARDEKSSSSSQSHNNSQSCSSDHAKTGRVSVKEDARTSAAGSGTVTKISGNSSQNRKSINGFPGPLGVQRETGASKKFSLHRNSASEEISQSSLTCGKATDDPMAEGNSHKFIVKIPNRGRSPAQSASGGSFEDHLVTNSRASSPVLSEKHEQLDHNMKEKSDAYWANVITDVNTESWRSNDFKDVLTGSDEGDGSPAAVPDEENCRTGEDARITTEVTKTASSSSGNELKSGKQQGASFSSINALIDSFVKYSEANGCMLVGDDAGMNLLASVAAGEIPKSDSASPIDSPERNTPAVEHSATGNDTKLKPSAGYEVIQDRNQAFDGADDEHLKQSVFTGNSWTKNADSKNGSFQETSGVELNEHLTSNMDLPRTADQFLKNGKLKEIITEALVNLPSASPVEKTTNIGDSKEHLEKKAGAVDYDGSLETKQKGSTSVVNQDKVTDPGGNFAKEVAEGSSSVPFMEVDVEYRKDVTEGMDRYAETHQKSPAVIGHSIKGTDKEALPSGSAKDTVLETVNEVKAEKDVETDARSHASHSEKQKPEWETVTAQKVEHVEENLEGGEGCEPCVGPSPCKASSTVMETEQHIRPRGSKLAGAEADETEEPTLTTADTPTGGADADLKVEFDLNEGFNVDEGNFGEPNNLTAAACSAPVRLISPLPFPVSFVSGSLPASITVAAAAKGPFVPLDDLLRTQGALRWKGSAATSAFRPAARKTLDMPLDTSNGSIPEATTGKQSRPPFDIDLNVPDERVLEDLASRSSAQGTNYAPDLTNNRDLTRGLVGSAPIRSAGGFDLDLNRVDEPVDLGNCSTGNSCRLDNRMQPLKSSSCGILNGEASVCRDFDLNNGPAVDELSAEPSLFSQHNRSSNVRSQPPVSSLRINNTEIPNFSSWFPTGNTYSAVTIPSIMPDGEPLFPIGPQRVLVPPTGDTPFNSDVYRGPVLSSSPAVPFPSTSFQYPVFPFGATFPLPSTGFPSGSTTLVDSSHGGRLCLPSAHSQLLGPAGAVASRYPRPYVVSLADGSNISIAGRKWGREGLDLNAGPRGPDIEGRDETTALASRQLSVASSQVLAEEQATMYQLQGGILKRKELEGGWDGYKQSSWQ